MAPALLARPPPAANTASRSAAAPTSGPLTARRSAAPLLPLYLQPSARRMLPQGAAAARRALDAAPAPSEEAPETSEETPRQAGEQQRDAEGEAQQGAARQGEEPEEASAETEGEAADGEPAAAGGAEEGASAQGEEGAPAEGAPAEGEAAGAVRDAGEQGAAAPGGRAAGAPARPEPPPPPFPIIPIPRLGGIRMPRVPNPPQSAVRRRGEILAQTGSTPEVHHGLVAQAVLRVVEAARTAQRDIVWRVGNLALNARMSIEDLALEVPRLVGNAIGIVRAAVRETLAAVRASAEGQISHIEANRGRIVSDFAATRTQVMGDIRTHLRDGSTALKEADDALQAQFTAHLGEAGTQIKQIPQNGTFTPINLPPMKGAAPAPPAAPAKAVRPGNLTEAEEDIRSALTGAEGKTKLRVWQDIKCADVLPGTMALRKTAMLEAAEARSKELDSAATRGEFARISFGLIAPTAQAAEDDAEGDAPRAQNKVEGEQRQVRTAADQAIDSLRDKLKGVEHALDPNRPKTAPFQVEKGLREAGERIAKMLRQQARAAEAGIRASAAAMAETYPDMVERVKPLLPDGQLLDSGERVPRLAKARDGIGRVHASQVATVRERANVAVDDARTALLAQGRSLTDMANNGARSIRDMVIPATFDFELVGALYVDPMNAGARLVTDRVIGYAERVAEGLMRPMAEADNGVSVVERTAVGFLNSNITGEHRGFLAQIAAIKDDLEKRGQLFPTIRTGVETDLAARTSKLSGMLTSGSFGGAAASTVAGGGVGLVVYLAMTDADDEGATGVIGELPWPGAPALEEVFLAETKETLRDRIANASLSDAQRQRLLNLLSADAQTRVDERQRIAEESTGIFTGPSREVREQVLRGMGADERATMSPAQLEQLQANLRSSLRGSELQIAIAYTEGNPGQVLAARMQERLDAANRGSQDETVLAMDQIEALARVELGGSFGAAFVQPSQIQAEVNAMYPEFERLTAAPDTPAATRDRATPLSPTEMTRARESFVAYATRPHLIYVGEHEPLEVPVSDRVREVVTTVAMHDSGSREAWVARAGYEVARADSEARAAWTGSLSSETQARVTRHTEDPVLARAHREVDRLEAQLRDAPENRREAIRQRLEAERRGLASAQTEHDTRMGLLAKNLDPTADVREPGAGTRLVAQRVGGIFARGDEEDRRYGTEMITQGRASMAAGVRLAVRGLGTNEELLGMVTANRSHLEIAQANREYKELHGESMTAAIYDDVSGDLALQMELALEGEPENDRDRLRLAAIRHRQETVSGTGFIARRTMADTWQLENINRRRDELGDVLLQSALSEARRTQDPDAVAWLSTLSPAEIYDAEGNVMPGVAALAFDESGNMHGDAGGIAFDTATSRLNSAADSYRAEIDRQESMMTSLITGLAIALSVVLLVVPGVNLIAAGILTALIAGAATIAVKSGMRGGRYGWEEMATDVAMTAVEAATAGAGGAMAGGLGKVGLAGRFAAIGTRMETAFGGKVGAAIAREAIVSAVNHSAQTAMQDETWNRGLERGLLRVAGSAARGAALGGVTAGVSTHLQGRMTSALGNVEKSGAVQRLGRTLGTSGQNVLAEAVSQSLGAMAGETAGVLVGRMTGQSHGSWRDDLRQIGQAGLRDLLTGAARAGVQNANRARYREKLAELRTTAEPTPEQMRSLRLAAISAGVQIGGREATYDLPMEALRREIAVGRAALSGLPPTLARQLAGADEATLIAANRMLASGEAASPKARAAFIAQLNEAAIHGLAPDLDHAAFGRDLETAHNAIHASDAPPPAAGSTAHAQARAARGILVSELEGPVRGALRDLPMEGLAGAPEAVLRGAASMVAHGTFDPAVAGALLKAARAANPHLDEASFNRNLIAAVETGRIAVQTRQADLARRRQALLEAAPEEAHAAIRALPDAEMERLSRRLERGEVGNRQQRDAMLRAVPPEHRAALDSALDAMARTASARIEQARATRRAARLEWLGDVPEELRAALSTLPDHALLALQAAHASGESVPPARRARMVADALRETPGVDGATVRKAIDGMLALPRPASEASVALRAELIAAIPPAERHLVADVPLLVMDDAAFAAFTRSRKGDAVTLIVDGRPIVVIRRGADPHVLQEEGLHVLQARSPVTARRAAMLDERAMADWDTLPLARQMELYRAKLGLEIDAHERLLASIEARSRSASPEQAAQLARQRMVAEEALGNLRRRQTEVAGVSALQQARIAAGFAPRPDWLDQPARLFGKKPRVPPPPNAAEIATRVGSEDPELLALVGRQLAKLDPKTHDLREHLDDIGRLTKTLDRAELHKLLAAAIDSPTPHSVVSYAARLTVDNPTIACRVLSGEGGQALITRIETFRFLAIEARRSGAKTLVNEIAEHFLNLDPAARADTMDVFRAAVAIAQTSPDAIATLSRFTSTLAGLRGIPLADLHLHLTSIVGVRDISAMVHTMLSGPGKLDAKAFSRVRSAIIELVDPANRAGRKEVRAAIDAFQRALRADPNKTPGYDELVKNARGNLEFVLQQHTTQSLSAEQAVPLMKQFFEQFDRLKQFADPSVQQRRPAFEQAVARMQARGVELLELRGLHKILDKDGVPDLIAGAVAGIIISQARNQLVGGRHMSWLEVDVPLHIQILGFDISGQELMSLLPRWVFGAAAHVANRNYDMLNKWFAMPGPAGEGLAARVAGVVASDETASGRLAAIAKEAGLEAQPGRTPHQLAQELHTRLAQEREALRSLVEKAGDKPTTNQTDAIETQARRALEAAGQLNRANRVVREALEKLASTMGPEVLPFKRPTTPDGTDFIALLGTTIHAGEQVATRRLEQLLDDIDVALTSGTDRIGHAVVLGLRLDSGTLGKLGFTRANENAPWVRGDESYSAARIEELNGKRLKLLQRAAEHGVVLEVPPTSNIVLNNLGIATHPVHAMLADAPQKGPPLRVSVATDNPGVHNIDVRSEMALLLATGAITWPQAVRFALEGFAGRMGGRPITGADELATRMADGITASTRGDSARLAVLDELKRRWPDAAPASWPTNLSDDAVFRELLRRFVERATQGRVAGGATQGP